MREAQLLRRALLWKPPLGPNPPFWSHPTHIIHLCNNTRHASNLYPLLSPETTIPKSLDAGVKACTATPVWAVIIFGWGSAISNLGQQRFPRGETEWEICTTTHLCRAEIGWKQMAAHWMPPSACGHPPEKITSQEFFFSFYNLLRLNPKLRKVRLFFFLTPTLLLQTALIS